VVEREDPRGLARGHVGIAGPHDRAVDGAALLAQRDAGGVLEVVEHEGQPQHGPAARIGPARGREARDEVSGGVEAEGPAGD
jgi:hypothetical protein